MNGKLVIDGRENEPLAFVTTTDFEREDQLMRVFCPHHHVWHTYVMEYQGD